MALAMVASVTLVVGIVAVLETPFALNTLGKLSPKALASLVEGGDVAVLVETMSEESSEVVALIEALDGSVSFQYERISALSAILPANGLWTLAASDLVKRVFLDEVVDLDAGEDLISRMGALGGDPDALLKGVPLPLQEDFRYLTREELQQISPEVYNLALTNALGTAQARIRTDFGAGTTVAIIDTGIWGGHFMLTDAVVGGIDLSPDVGTEFEGFDRPDNHWHGSHVAGIAAGFGAIGARPGSLLVKSIEQHTGVELPTLVIPGVGRLKVIPLLGMAPFADVYAIKVFPHTGAGVPSSTIIAAIEHAIEVKDEISLDVVSMSLGGSTRFDGRTLIDRATDAAVDAGLFVVSAGGNEGPATMTVASPGSAHKGMAVAATAMPVNVRVLWDLFHGNLKAGNDLFVSDDPQVISFSSRGPTADDRMKPDVAAPGVFILSAFPSAASPQGLAFASGTSMATPHVSGAALLVKALAKNMELPATATDIKFALRDSATPLPLYGERDFGAGLINANAALDALLAAELGAEEDSLPDVPVPLADISTGEIDMATLVPGESLEVVFATDLETASITLEITDVDLGKDAPRGQRWLRNFGWHTSGQPQVNSLEVYIHGAKRAGSFFDYEIDSGNVWGDATFVVTDDATTAEGDLRLDVPIKPFGDFNARMIEPGFYKIVIENDWTSFDSISFSYTISVETAEPMAPDLTISGEVDAGDFEVFFLLMPEGIGSVTFVLKWENDWSMYPTYDLDLLLFRFVEEEEGFVLVDFQAATLNAPEKSVIAEPEGGLWALVVDGFSIPLAESSEFTIEIIFVET